MSEATLAVTVEQSGPIPLDVSFECAAGEVLAILGPSGSGKTTILRTIAGLYQPARAVVRVGSATWTDTAAGMHTPAHLRRVGFVFQDYALFPHMTAKRNVMTALGHLPKRERAARADALLGLVHLSDCGHRRPDQLSGGERQRVALARAWARDPEVILLDEPFAAVDYALRRRLQDELDVMRRSLGVPVILVTHDVADVQRLATRVLLLEHGRATSQGPVAGLDTLVGLAGDVRGRATLE